MNLIGQTLSQRYRFEALIGEGTFARVYRIHDLKRGVDLAAKVLRADIAQEPSFLERFRREAAVLAQLHHPHIVRYYETVETDGVAFITLEYIDGETLQTHLYNRDDPMTAHDALRFIKPMSAALTYAHGENIIHRDIKPANILIAHNGQVYLTDFGIARLLDSANTTTQGMSVGTPLYMSPEQIQGAKNITLATDIYSMGILLYLMLTGQLPFRGRDESVPGSSPAERVAYEHINLPPLSPRKINPAISPAVQEVILKCLRKDPGARFLSAVAVYDALAESLGTTPSALSPVAWREEEKPQPPDVTLPEWSFVREKAADDPTAEQEAVIRPQDVPFMPPDRVAEIAGGEGQPFPSSAHPTLVAGGDSAAKVTLLHNADSARETEPNLRREALFPAAPPPSESSYRPAYAPASQPRPVARVRPQGRRTANGRRWLWISVLVAVGLTLIIATCIALSLFSASLLSDDANRGNPTRRPTRTPTEMAAEAESEGAPGGFVVPTIPPLNQ